ncbi:hypothetical protein ACFQY0_11835 [Haloferula chungangensis]|uniref:PEP-CTERM sorting domain-containing protein n=1 Tax=Haloferula chungangensis TaxID=1048331 RepID=A0ABW2L8R8_9BACT
MIPQTNILATGIAGIFLTSFSAQAALWDGGGLGDEFSTAENWADDTFPGNLEAGAKLAEINGVFTVERSVDSVVERSSVGGGATLNIPSGTHSDDQSGAGTRTYVGNGSDGTVVQSGGSWNIGHALVIGNGASGNGLYVLNGGDLLLTRGANSVVDPQFGRPSLDVAGNGGAGSIDISGGTFATRFGVNIGANGTFHVAQSGLTVGIATTSSGDGWWIQKAGGTLRTGIDAGGATNIIVQDSVAAKGVLFEDGAILDPYDAGGAGMNTWFTVMTLSGEGAFDDQGLSLSPDAISAGWEKQLVGSSLQVRLIPEPSVALLGGLGLLGLLRRRRH